MSEGPSESVGSISVDVVPDARGFKAKLDAELRDLTATIKAILDDAVAREGLDEVANPRTATIRPNVSEADKAKASGTLDWIARTRTAVIRVVTQHVGDVLGGLGIGAATAVALPAAAGIGAFGAGSALFGAIGLQQAKQAQEAVKAYQKATATAQKAQQAAQQAAAVASQKAALASQGALTAASQRSLDRTAQAAALRAQQAQAKANQAAQAAGLAAPTAQQTAYVNAVNGFKAVLQTVSDRVGALKLFTTGLNDAAKLLPELIPILKVTGAALGRMLDDLAKAAGSRGGRQVIRQIAQDIRAAAPVIEDLAKDLGRLFLGLLDNAPTALNALHKVFDYLSRIPSTVIAPLTSALIGLFVGGPWVAGAAAAGALFAQLYMHSSRFRGAISRLVDMIKKDFKPTIDALVQQFNKSLLPAFEAAKPYLEDLAKKIGKVVQWLGQKGLPTAINDLLPVLGQLISQGAIAADVFAKIADAIIQVDKQIDKMTPKLGGLSGIIKDVASVLPGIGPAVTGAQQASDFKHLLAGGPSTVQAPGRPKRTTVVPQFSAPPGSKSSGSLNDILGLSQFAPRVNINVGTVKAHDYHDFMSQMQRRKQRAALGGVG